MPVEDVFVVILISTSPCNEDGFVLVIPELFSFTFIILQTPFNDSGTLPASTDLLQENSRKQMKASELICFITAVLFDDKLFKLNVAFILRLINIPKR